MRSRSTTTRATPTSPWLPSTLTCRRRTEPRSPCWTATSLTRRMATAAPRAHLPPAATATHQHGQFVHDSLCQSQRRLADHRSGMQRHQQLLPLQPTRVIFPTEIFRLQSSSIKNISMNGNVRYTDANMNLPNYYEHVPGPARSEPLDMLMRATRTPSVK